VTRDHNTDNLFVPPHTQESNITENEARVWCVHKVGAKQNRQNQKHEVDGRRAKQPLVRGAMGKNRCRQPVDSVDSCESGFTPKRSRNQRGKENSTNSV
jgi:hypothetical protein